MFWITAYAFTYSCCRHIHAAHIQCYPAPVSCPIGMHCDLSRDLSLDLNREFIAGWMLCGTVGHYWRASSLLKMDAVPFY